MRSLGTRDCAFVHCALAIHNRIEIYPKAPGAGERQHWELYFMELLCRASVGGQLRFGAFELWLLKDICKYRSCQEQASCKLVD